jgi:hypothetical protein
MSKVDWSKAPEGAEFFCGEYFYKADSSGLIKFFRDNEWNDSALQSRLVFMQQHDYEVRPTISSKSPDWPDEERIDRIVRDRTSDDLGHYEATELTTAADFLSAGLEILSQRGEQYGNDGRECSFPQAAEAFNAITGHSLKGSDICLIIALVKQVRQYAQPGRFHEDSAVDGVNYVALQSELLKKERK